MKKEGKLRQPLLPEVRRREAGLTQTEVNGGSVQEVSESQNPQESRKARDCRDGAHRLGFGNLGDD